MIKITKARRHGIIMSLLVLPLFLAFAIWAIYEGLWLEGLGILGGWLFFFLFATSYLFQALVVLLASVYVTVALKVWWAVIPGILLTAYLYRASRITDEDMAALPGKLKAISPTLGNIMEFIADPRKRLVAFLGIGILATAILIIIFLVAK